MEDIREQMELGNEISAAISNPVGMSQDVRARSAPFSSCSHRVLHADALLLSAATRSWTRTHSRPSSTSSSRRHWTSSLGRRIPFLCTHRAQRRQQQDCPLRLRDSQVGHRRRRTRTGSSRSCRLLWPCNSGSGTSQSRLYVPVEVMLRIPPLSYCSLLKSALLDACVPRAARLARLHVCTIARASNH